MIILQFIICLLHIFTFCWVCQGYEIEEYNCSAFPEWEWNGLKYPWTNCPRNEYMIEHNLIQCYSKKWNYEHDYEYSTGTPSIHDCWSRKDVDEEFLKNNVTITTEYSNDGIDIRYISASFKYNGTHLNCIAQEDWAQNLPVVLDFNGYDYYPCITNTSLMATFEIKHSDDFSSIKVAAWLSIQSNNLVSFTYDYECDATMDYDTLNMVCKSYYNTFKTIKRPEEATIDCYKQVNGSNYTFWAHVWGVPCNSKVECENGFDEENCVQPDWILPAILASVFTMIFITKFLYLYKNINHEIRSFSTPIQQPNPLNCHWLVATLLNEGRFDEVKEFYVKEIIFHASEPNTICCLKNLLDPESFTKMMQALKSPTPVSTRRKNYITKKLREMSLCAIYNEEYVLNEQTKRFVEFCTLLMFCLLNPQTNACEPNPKTTSSDFNR